jgi:hypothetical protein
LFEWFVMALPIVIIMFRRGDPGHRAAFVRLSESGFTPTSPSSPSSPAGSPDREPFRTPGKRTV